jgi:hypothetical protein
VDPVPDPLFLRKNLGTKNSPLLGLSLFFSFVIFFYIDGKTPWTNDQPVARPLPTHGTTQTQIKSTHRHPCLEWDSNPRFQRSSERRQFMSWSLLYSGLNLKMERVTHASEASQVKNSSLQAACMCWRRVSQSEANAPTHMLAPYWSLRTELYMKPCMLRQ